MKEVKIDKKTMLLEWEKFQNTVLPPEEMQKEWAQTVLEDWDSLPQKEKQCLPELDAFVRRILDSSEECIPGIYDEVPADLKRLLFFRLKRAESFFQNYLKQNDLTKVPEEGDYLRSFFRHMILQS
jgi:hypothetical protein